MTPAGREDAPVSRLGLTQGDAEERLRREGPNELPKSERRKILSLVLHVLKEPMILLLLCSGAVYLLLGNRDEALLLLGSIGLIIGIEFYQERKTERALEALRDLSSPRARVLRDGEARRIPGREVVREDLVLVAEGDRVPADALVLTSTNLVVDESLLTGESAPVRKANWTGGPESGPPGGDATPFVFSGTLVVRGSGTLRVLATGERSQLGKIGRALQEEPTGKTRLQQETAQLVRYSAIAGVSLCVVVVVVHGLTRHSWLEAALAGLALGISLMPEEFPVILTVFMALGAWRIARSRVLTRRAPAIETLGSATVLCVDKTGTLTQNRMDVRMLIAEGVAFDVGASGELPEVVHPVVEYAILASQRDPFDPMDRALKELGERTLRGTEHLHRDWTLVREYPLSPELLALSRVWKSPTGNDFVIAAKGAPEAVVDLCHLNAERSGAALEEVRKATDQGFRVLGVARSRFTLLELPGQQHDFDFEWVGLVGFEDPIRITVPDAIRECTVAGIRTVMITGDYPGTARTVARKLGLPGAEVVLTGADLDGLSEAEVQDRARTVNVFARMVPEQKLRLVRALKGNGEVVAMTGDGVNDAPALKAAHIGIAMGSRGTDVARESAALVLLDDDFASIVHAVRLGRRIYDNLRKAMAYVIAVHVPIAGTALVPVLLGWPLVLFPAHIVFIEFIIDPICSIAFEAEPEERDVMSRPPRPVGARLFSWSTWAISLLQGAGVLVAVIVALHHARVQGLAEGEGRALAFTMLVVGNLSLVLSNRSWSRGLISTLRQPNRTLGGFFAAALGILALTLYVPFFARLFRFEELGALDLAVVAGGGVFCLLWCELLKSFRARMERAPRGRPG
jgi:Ca2+-transporting ATPase